MGGGRWIGVREHEDICASGALAAGLAGRGHCGRRQQVAACDSRSERGAAVEQRRHAAACGSSTVSSWSKAAAGVRQQLEQGSSWSKAAAGDGSGWTAGAGLLGRRHPQVQQCSTAVSWSQGWACGGRQQRQHGGRCLRQWLRRFAGLAANSPAAVLPRPVGSICADGPAIVAPPRRHTRATVQAVPPRSVADLPRCLCC